MRHAITAKFAPVGAIAERHKSNPHSPRAVPQQ